MLHTWKEINEKYNVVLNNGKDGELSEIEKKIYNGDFTIETIDCTNPNNLIALSNYYMLIKNNQLRLLVLQKLLDIGDHRGYANLGAYYFYLNRPLAIQYLEFAAQSGNLDAMFNLAMNSIEMNDFDKGLEQCEKLIELNYVPAYMLQSRIYGYKNNVQKMFESLGKGIEKKCTNCFKSLEMFMANDPIQIKTFLSGLDPNEFVLKLIDQTDNIINGNTAILDINFNS